MSSDSESSTDCDYINTVLKIAVHSDNIEEIEFLISIYKLDGSAIKIYLSSLDEMQQFFAIIDEEVFEELKLSQEFLFDFEDLPKLFLSLLLQCKKSTLNVKLENTENINLVFYNTSVMKLLIVMSIPFFKASEVDMAILHNNRGDQLENKYLEINLNLLNKKCQLCIIKLKLLYFKLRDSYEKFEKYNEENEDLKMKIADNDKELKNCRREAAIKYKELKDLYTEYAEISKNFKPLSQYNEIKSIFSNILKKLLKSQVKIKDIVFKPCETCGQRYPHYFKVRVITCMNELDEHIELFRD